MEARMIAKKKKKTKKKKEKTKLKEIPSGPFQEIEQNKPKLAQLISSKYTLKEKAEEFAEDASPISPLPYLMN